MIISRACKVSNWIVLAGVVSACSGAPLATSTSQLPTYSGVRPVSPPTSTVALPTSTQPMISATSTPEPAARTWAERPFGADKVAITFYADPNGSKCLRYTIGSRSNAACASSRRSTLLALQGIEADSAGTVYSIIVGRTFSDQITAVSFEFTDGSNTPAEVDDGGFLVILPGQRTAIWAIPIDQYGNLVGDKFTFNR